MNKKFYKEQEYVSENSNLTQELVNHIIYRTKTFFKGKNKSRAYAKIS